MTLVILAGLAPAAPAALAQSGVRAAQLSPIADVADCSPATDGMARYFVSVRSTSGADINSAVGRLIGTGTANRGQSVNMSNGDFESQAMDGIRPSCHAAINDGHANDLGTTYLRAVATTDTWSLVINAAGYNPLGPIDISAFVDGTVCPLGDGFGCLISLGTVQLTPLSVMPGRGLVSGTVFGADGAPVDGATVVASDVSGNVSTQTSGRGCSDAAMPGTGFFCFSDSDPFTPGNDGLGLPVGPASLVVVANTSSPAAGCAAGTPCGLLPAGVIVQVAGGVATGGNVVLTSKLAPVTGPSSGAGAFGYVMNFQGVGIGGYTITATAAGAPTVTAVSATQTGLWTMSGLAANTTYTFTLNGPGVVDSNVRPAQSVTARTAAAGRWVDPSFVITAPGVGPLPLPGLGGRVVLALQNDGAGPSLSWTLPASGTPSYLVARLSARGVTVLPTSGIPLPSTTTNFADSSTPGVPVQCYTVLLVDGSPPALQGNSDVLCTSAGVRSASGAPEGFTIRLSTASTVSLIWAPPQTGGLDGYRLVPLGGMPLDLASSVLSQDQSISGPACFALLAMAHGAAIGNTELLCAVPGLANPPQ